MAERVEDGDVMHLLKVMLKANGKRGVPRVISPLLSNLYLNEVDRAGEGGHALQQVHRRRIREVR